MLALRCAALTVLRTRTVTPRRTRFIPLRPLSTSPRRRAAQIPDSFVNAVRNSPLYKKLEGNQEALEALAEFGKILQELGLDVSSGKPPSTLQMVKLATNSQFRDSARRVYEEMQKAGIDLKSQDVMQEIMNLKKASEG